MDTLGDAIAIQRASWRKPRAIDFRSIQGAINADGFGNLLSGIGGTVPNTTYGASIAIAELTGIASRAVGVWAGILFIVLAFLPKLVAVVVALPGPVAGAYLAIIVALIFVFGVKILTNDGLDYRKSLIVGFAFWVGLAFQFDMIYPELLQGFWGNLMGQGMTAGGITVILLSGFLDLTGRRPRRLRSTLSIDALPVIDAFLCDFAKRTRCDEPMTNRLRAVAEEAVHTLLGDGGWPVGGSGVHRGRRGRKPRGTARDAERGRDGFAERGGDAAAVAAALRDVGTPPAIPRHGHRDVSGGTAVTG